MKKPRARIAMLKPSVTMANLSTAKPLAAVEPVNYGQGRGGRPWRRKRDAVMARDKYRCQPCKRAGATTQAEEVDHIVPQFEGGTDDETNLEAICCDCHKVKTQAEAARAKRSIR